jgi:hypothetical protein
MDLKNNGTTLACLITFQMSTNVMGFKYSRKITNVVCIRC